MNNRFVLRLLCVFILIDLLVAGVMGTGALVQAEKMGLQAAELVREEGLPGETEPDLTVLGGYSLKTLSRDPKGFPLPGFIQAFLPDDALESARYFTLPEGKGEFRFSQLEELVYHYEFSVKKNTYGLELSLAAPVNSIKVMLQILFIVEILILLKTAFSGAGQIRRKLKPIEDLAEAAQNLNTAGNGLDLSLMETLADKIDGINAAKLDTRISIDATQDELKDLAEAINAMLARINDAYRSQMRFVSDASHELRTPISVIQGYANLLERWGKDDEKTLLESIQAIRDEAANMKSLVEQLLFLARGDNNTMVLQLEDFDLGELAEAVVKECEMIDNGHDYQRQIQRVFVHADHGLIKQLLRILTDNAIKYSNPGGTIRISLSEDEGKALLSVQDEGIGIPPQSVPLIFERFYRADESRARATGGTGLGLSIAKWIAEKHGGHLEVLSREGIGTRVIASIPSVPSKESLPAKLSCSMGSSNLKNSIEPHSMTSAKKF